MALSRDAILTADDLRREEVKIPEWNGSVFVRMMTAGERDRYEYEVSQFSAGKLQDIRARLAVYTCCDEAGTPLFTTADVPKLSSKCGPALDRIFEAAIRLNKISKDDIDELEKNSGTDRSSST